MRVLAFDPGFGRLGAAVLEKQNGKEILLYSDCVRTSAKTVFSERLKKLGEEVEKLIKKWQPDTVALESVFFENNAKTAMDVSRVAGMLVYLAARRGLPVFEYTPLQVKVAIAGHGRATKQAVATMLPRLIRLPDKKRLDDEVDAIAVGLTCLCSVRN